MAELYERRNSISAAQAAAGELLCWAGTGGLDGEHVWLELVGAMKFVATPWESGGSEGSSGSSASLGWPLSQLCPFLIEINRLAPAKELEYAIVLGDLFLGGNRPYSWAWQCGLRTAGGLAPSALMPVEQRAVVLQSLPEGSRLKPGCPRSDWDSAWAVRRGSESRRKMRE